MTDKQPTKLDFNRVMPLFVLVFVDVLSLTLILPLLHLYGAAFGATPFQIGLIAAAFPLAQLIGVPMMGALSDRFGRKPLLLISQITTCISFIMLGFANSLEMVILSRVVDGLFGANIATAQAALSDITDESNRAQGLGLTGAAFGLGFIFGPILSLVALEAGNSLAVPAFSAALYSLLSIGLTWFGFQETLPPKQRGQGEMTRFNPFLIRRYLTNRNVNILLILMFAQQLIFFGFESLLGLFLMCRLGLLGQGSAGVFLVVGIVLVTVQARFIGRWSQRYGERKLVLGALALMAIGLTLFAMTPEQPHFFYVRELTAFDIAQQAPSTTEAILGDFDLLLPDETNRGWWGVIWVLIVVIPLTIGAGLIRPALNSMMTKLVSTQEYGSILGVSASFVSAANATAPLIGGYLFQQYGASAPFFIGGGLMAVLFVLSVIIIPVQSVARNSSPA
ncbi:MAG: MFS transporter [Anaerolineae bacterium]